MIFPLVYMPVLFPVIFVFSDFIYQHVVNNRSSMDRDMDRFCYLSILETALDANTIALMPHLNAFIFQNSFFLCNALSDKDFDFLYCRIMQLF